MEPKLIRCFESRPENAPPVLREELYRAAAHDFNLVQVAPGAGRPPHPYAEGDSFMLVLGGHLTLQVDGEAYGLEAGTLALIPRGATRGFTAGPEGATVFAAHLRA